MKLQEIVTLSELLENVAFAQEALQESEALNRAIIGSLPAHLAVIDRYGTIIAANEAWYRFAQENGDPPLNTIGIGVNYLEVGRKAAAAGNQVSLEMLVGIEAVIAGELLSFVYEYACFSPTEQRWFLMHVTPLRTKEGGVVIAHENITLLKQVEQALRHSEANMQTVFNSVSVAFILIGGDMTVRAVNHLAARRAQSIFGHKMQPGDSILDFVLPHDMAGFQENFARAMKGEYLTVPIQFDINGETIFYETRYHPVMTDKSDIIGVCMTSENITERKLSEAFLRESLERERDLGELKSQFVATASHEFRTPLTTIQSSAELLKLHRDKMTPERIDEHLAKIMRQVFNMNNLIDDVLLLGKAQSGKLDFKPEIVDIQQLFAKIIDDQHHTPNSQARLVFLCESRYKEGFFDPKLIKLMINNLVTNAIKYSLPHDPVLVELTCNDSHVILIVKDYGIGIPEKDQIHLFEPFFRASNTGTINGTGLGLSIIKQAVELHQGTIAVKSEVGKGTTVTVKLPTI